MQECESVIYIVQFVQVREKDAIIEEGWSEKQRRRSSRQFGGQICGSIPCHASCFVSVDLEETVELILFF